MKRLLTLFVVLLVTVPLMGQKKITFQVGADASADLFLSTNNRILPSFGVGVRGRLGGHDQWVNLIGGLRFIYGQRLQGFQIPIMLNVNLLKGEKLSGYLGAGYEFDFIGTYWGCMKFQAGVALKHMDFRLFYKPYQGDPGIGFTYYF